MPVNFSNALETSTPSIPTYNSPQGDDNYSFASAAESVTNLVTSYMESKRAQKEGEITNTFAEQALQARQDLLEQESDIQSQIDEERNKVDPKDKAGFTAIMSNIRRLEQQARQLRRDNGAQLLALQRQALRTYPQYTDSLLKIFNTTETLASNVIAEADQVKVDANDPFIQYVNQRETLALKANVSLEVAGQLMQDEADYNRLDREFKISSMKGEEALPATLAKVTSIFKQVRNESYVLSQNQTTPEGAKANSMLLISRGRQALDQYLLDLQAAGIQLGQQQLQQINAAFNSEAQNIEQFAGYVQTSAEVARKVRNDPNAGTFLAMAVAWKDDPVIMARIQARDPEVIKDYYEPFMKVVDGLRGADLSRLQAIANAGGEAGAKARTQLNALGRFATMEGGRALSLGTQQGQELSRAYFQINSDISAGKFDPKKIPVGSVAERLMYAATFRPGQNTPETDRAKQDVIQREYSMYISPEYDGGVNTRERLIFHKDISAYLDSSPGFRQTLIAQAKTDMKAIIDNQTGGGLFGDAKIRGLELNTFNFVKLDPKSRAPIFEGGTMGGSSVNNLDILNINARILARYWGKENTQAYLRELMAPPPEEKFVPSDAQGQQ